MLVKGNYQEETKTWGHIFSLSAWGFAIVLASFAFLYLGYKLDAWLGTAPNFMLGLFLLAVVTSVGRFFKEAWQAGREG